MTTDIKIEKVVNDKYVILYKTDEIYIGDIVNKKKIIMVNIFTIKTIILENGRMIIITEKVY